MKDIDTKERFILLRAQGKSFKKIAEQLKVSKQTLINWSKEFETEILNLKAIELEALQEKYYQSREKRIELFGERLRAIRDELGKRDLSEVSTEKLLLLFVRFASVIKVEYIQPDFRSETEIERDRELNRVISGS